MDLQNRVIPTLIGLFPKVQFIITSHSPLFLMGMESQFGPDGFTIVEMPSGTTITTERFSEFERSLAYYRETSSYESELGRVLASNQRPLVLMEGETDPRYLSTAIALAGRTDLLSKVEISWVGIRGRQGAEHSGVQALDNVANMLTANPDLSFRRVLLIYDCDAGKASVESGRVRKWSIPRNEQNVIANRGIENLLPSTLFEKRFYSRREVTGDYGASRIIEEFNKTAFCSWVCDERRQSTDFENFCVVIDMLDQLINADAGTRPN